MADYLVQEDGFQIDLEDGTGALLLDAPDFDPTRFTQAAVEVLVSPSADARFTQAAVEVLVQPVPDARFTQAGVEVVQRRLRESVIVIIID